MAGYLPTDYSGDTLDEIDRMVSDSIEEGLRSKKAAKRRTRLAPPPRRRTQLIWRSGRRDISHAAECRLRRPNQARCRDDVLPVRDEAMKGWVRLRYYKATGKTLSRESRLHRVLDLLEAKRSTRPQRKRCMFGLGGSNGDVYYDLGQSDEAFVRITPSGWTLDRTAPYDFIDPLASRTSWCPRGAGTSTHSAISSTWMKRTGSCAGLLDHLFEANPSVHGPALKRWTW